MEIINGFSKLNKEEKLNWLASQYQANDAQEIKELQDFWYSGSVKQDVLDDFSENTISNFPIPFSLAPNFLINEKLYTLPMAIEESSVVAAASRSAKFWLKRGGFKAKVLGTAKVGHVHFTFKREGDALKKIFKANKSNLLLSIEAIQKNMQKRGGGVVDIKLLDHTDKMDHYYALELLTETCDAMGANFINSLLEKLAETFKKLVPEVNIIMAILSNYTDECLVRAEVSCPLEEISFAEKFKAAVDIAKVNPKRAVTHNKGIFNGVDALVLATGNDFRAIEACGHAFAARSGQYCSLSDCEIEDGQFSFWLEMPMALGTVGGLTSLHPIAKRALKILGNPSASQLMELTASLGLAQNFAAIRSLVTTGIQQGHMKMHLLNILKSLHANTEETEKVKEYFNDKVVSFSAVAEYLKKLREWQ